MADDGTPSRIPVLNKRISLSLSSPSLNLAADRPASPLRSPPAVSRGPNGRASPATSSSAHRRQSLLSQGGRSRPPSRKASVSDGLNASSSDDTGEPSGQALSPSHADLAVLMLWLIPGHLRAHVLSLQIALVTAQKKLADAEIGVPVSPTLPDLSFGTPLKVHLIEEGNEEGRGASLDLEDPSIISLNDPSPSRGLPHSVPHFDLKSRAITPAKPDGRSRIPQAVVSHAAALHHSPSTSPSKPTVQPQPPSPITITAERSLRSPFLAPESPRPSSSLAGDASSHPSQSNGYHNGGGRLSPAPTPSPRKISGSAASTRVIDNLQTELVNSKGHVERLKQEMRASQRRVEQLTRQKEDLQETKERMRVECEGLNNVIARKERLLQEVLERARSAEATAKDLSSTRKALETSTKKSLQTMNAQVAEAQASQARSERECAALRDSVKSLRDVWAREMRGVKEDWKRGEEKNRREREEMRQKQATLLKLVQSTSAERANIELLAEQAHMQSQLASEAWRKHTAELRSQLEKGMKDGADAKLRAEELAGELVRLRRLMREPAREDLEAASKPFPGEDVDGGGASCEKLPLLEA
ncbi:hypothetical protein IAT38_004642 [Cryptococcus sp. DSM 104549]